MLRIIQRCRVPRFLHPESSHVCPIWTHVALLALRQHEPGSYGRLMDLLDECVGVQEHPGLSGVPHHAAPQKAAARLEGSLLHRTLREFILYKKARLVLAGIGGSGFSHGTAPHCCTKRAQLRRNFPGAVACAGMNSQLVCCVMIHHNMQHGNPGFLLLLEKTDGITPGDIVLGDMGFDGESNHVGARKTNAAAAIPTRCSDVPMRGTGGCCRKETKRGFPTQLHRQRNKSGTVFFVIKHMMSGDITSGSHTAQAGEMLYRLIACNAYRVTKLDCVILAWFLHGPSFHVFAMGAFRGTLFYA